MREQSPPVVIFGAGKTGRGFAAHLCQMSGVPFILVDQDRQLVERLRLHRRYEVHVLSDPEHVAVLEPNGVYHTSDEGWIRYFESARLCFTAVFGNNLPELGHTLAIGLKRRFRDPSHLLPATIVTCENLNGAANVLREAVLQQLGGDTSREVVDRNVGFSEGMILKTCLDPRADGDPLSLLAEDFFELPCDRAEVRGGLPELKGLQPQDDFSHQLLRKIYTYNCINAVISYLGARQGIHLLSDAAADPEIREWAERARDETSAALIREFGFDPAEQESWGARALRKFANASLPDPLSRNGADPRRKLSRTDRLIGPALLALKHGIKPRAIVEGVLAAVHFPDLDGQRLIDHFPGSDPHGLLTEVCELRSDEPLYEYIVTHWTRER